MLRALGNLPWVWVVSWASAPACPRGSEVRTRGPGGSWKSRLPPAQSSHHPWQSQSHQGCCLPPRSLSQIPPQRVPDTPSQCCWQLCSSATGGRVYRHKKGDRGYSEEKIERVEKRRGWKERENKSYIKTDEEILPPARPPFYPVCAVCSLGRRLKMMDGQYGFTFLSKKSWWLINNTYNGWNTLMWFERLNVSVMT